MNSTRLSVHSKIVQVELWKFRRGGISGPKFYLWNRTRDMLQQRKSQCNRRANQRICGKNRQQSNSAVLHLLISYRSGYRSSYSSLWITTTLGDNTYENEYSLWHYDCSGPRACIYDVWIGRPVSPSQVKNLRFCLRTKSASVAGSWAETQSFGWRLPRDWTTTMCCTWNVGSWLLRAGSRTSGQTSENASK